MLTKDNIKKIGLEVGWVIEQNVTLAMAGRQTDVSVLKTDVGVLKSDVGIVKTDADGLKSDAAYIKTQTITPTYLDDKLADWAGGTLAGQRKKDQKVNLLIKILENKKVLQEANVKQFQEFQIFPLPIGKN